MRDCRQPRCARRARPRAGVEALLREFPSVPGNSTGIQKGTRGGDAGETSCASGEHSPGVGAPHSLSLYSAARGEPSAPHAPRRIVAHVLVFCKRNTG